MSSVIFLVFRRMRAPMILLIAIYAVAVLGLSLIPGVDADGRPAPPMSIFHAFYFVSYTATTIGFGELPATFGDAQRMWTTVIIYLSVVGWSYLIVTLFGLAQDRAFQHALATGRFVREVRGLKQPFYLICGCGETGRSLLRALDTLDLRCVVIDIDENRVNELELEDLRGDVPAIVGDAKSPQLLELAGLTHPRCRGALALTNDDAVNLAVAASARLLNPDLRVIARAQSPMAAANMTSFGVRHVINPFEKFADYLRLAMREPDCYRLLDWLLALPGTRLRTERAPPRGEWVICGHGRFGKAVAERLSAEGAVLRIVDPDAAVAGAASGITGVGTEAPVLEAAGVRRAEGLVAGTDNDINNLAIAVTAREINPEIFLAVRQNQIANRKLFNGIEADLLMVASEIIAHECFALLTAPLLGRFLEVIQRQRDPWAHALIERLSKVFGDRAPELWSARIDRASAPALVRWLADGHQRTTLADVLRDPLDRDRSLDCIVLLMVRGDGSEIVLPDGDEELRPMTSLLFASTIAARSRLEMTARNANELEYVCTGTDRRGGWLAQFFGGIGRRGAAVVTRR
jgi:voltage-gated potassium channel